MLNMIKRLEEIIAEQEEYGFKFDMKLEEYNSLLDGAVALPDNGFTVFDSLEDLENMKNVKKKCWLNIEMMI